VDGIVPNAKINQQRQRRFRTIKHPNDKFNTNQITPGTEFMFKLDDYLRRFLEKNKEILPPKIIYSSHMVPGEGEHKIFDYLRDGEISGNGAHLINGIDADLFMISLLSPKKELYLVRNLEGGYLKDKTITNTRNIIISIDRLRDTINKEMGTLSGYKDFVVLSYFLGNDFLPSHPSLQEIGRSLDLLIYLYKEIKESNQSFTGLTNTDDVDIVGLYIFMKVLANYEPELLAQIALNTPKYPNETLKECLETRSTINKEVNIINMDKFSDLWRQKILGIKNVDLEQRIKEFTNENINDVFRDNDMNDVVLEYISGFRWIYRYYYYGTFKVDTRYVYKYNYAPLFRDIMEYFKTSSEWYIVNNFSLLVSIFQQLLIVLPRKDSYLLPSEISPLVKDISVISDFYPDDFIEDLEGKNEEHMGIVILPPIDFTRSKLVNTIKLHRNVEKKFEEQKDNIVVDPDRLQEVRSNASRKNIQRESYGNDDKFRNQRGEERGTRQEERTQYRGPRQEERTQYRGPRQEERNQYRGPRQEERAPRQEERVPPQRETGRFYDRRAPLKLGPQSSTTDVAKWLRRN